MKKTRILPLILAVAMLTACGASPEESSDDYLQSAANTTVASTADISDDSEPELVFPEIEHAADDEAAGNFIFYINDTPIYAGMKLSRALSEHIYSPFDLDATLDPGDFSLPMQLQFNSDGNDGIICVAVMNHTQEALPLKDCLIYSLTATYPDGVEMGATHLCTGKTTKSEILALYGDPTEHIIASDYDVLVYYTPMSCITFYVKANQLKQVTAYHISQLYEAEIDAISDSLSGNITSRDGYYILNNYFDVQPYLDGEEGPLCDLSTTVTIDGKEVTLGTIVSDLPEPWSGAYENLEFPISYGRLMRAGLADMPEFQIFNDEIDFSPIPGPLKVQGVYLVNPAYDNFGADYSTHVDFSYMGISSDDGLEKIIEVLGSPNSISTVCNEGLNYAWLYYAAENGDLAQFKVDLFSDEIIELRVLKFYENAREYS